MAFDTYANLQTAIQNRMNTSAVSSYLTDFIRVAEDDLSRWLRALFNQRRSYTVPTDAYVALPTDYLQLVSIQFAEGGYRHKLEQVSPHLLDQVKPSTSSGTPRYYAIHDNQFEFRPAFAADNTSQVEITYYFRPTLLSDSNTTNEYLENIPDMLFYRSLVEGFDTMFDEPRSQKYMGLYEKAKADFLKQQNRAKWSGVPLRVMPDTQYRMG